MKDGIILIIDTTSEELFVGLYDNGKYDKVIISDAKFSHSVKLLPTIDQLLEINRLKINDVEAISLSVGPGSFTGIRIGVATAKAFEYALNMKVIAVDSLLITAYNYIQKGEKVTSLIDAKHDNAYVGVFSDGKEQLSFVDKKAFEKMDKGDVVVSPKENSFNALITDSYYDNLLQLTIDKYNKKEFSSNYCPLYLKLSQAEEEENAVKKMDV